MIFPTPPRRIHHKRLAKIRNDHSPLKRPFSDDEYTSKVHDDIYYLLREVEALEYQLRKEKAK
jgi:hypothetical protein